MRVPLVRQGMPVFDCHEQLLGEVAAVRPDSFILRQRLCLHQLVQVPIAALGGVVAGVALLTLTAGELEIFGRPIVYGDREGTRDETLERAERDGTTGSRGRPAGAVA